MNRWLLILLVAALSVAEASAQSPDVRSSQVVNIAGTDYYIHTVAPGETVYSLSRLYGVSERSFYEDNPDVEAGGLKAGETVRIRCAEVPQIDMPRRKIRRTFLTHTVQPGETTYSIAKRYSLSLATLIEDNPGLDPAHLGAGQDLFIRKSQMDKTSPQQILSQLDDFAETLSGVSDEYSYHPVEMGETLYSISREYGVPIADIEAHNNLQDGLRAGVLLKIPLPGRDHSAEGQNGMGAGNAGREETSETANERSGLPGIRRPHRGVVNVSLLLPFTEEGEVRPGFMEFYQGALIAAEELRDGGHSMEINVFDTRRSPEVIADIVRSEAFRNSDLIIGPVYEEGLSDVMEFSERTGVPVVSPLDDLERSYGGTLFQLSPAPKYRYDKMKELLEGEKNIVFITSDITDHEFEKEMKAVVGNRPYQMVHYRKGTPSQQIDRLITGRDGENVFIVVAGDETGVDLILAALSSVQNSRLARSVSTGPIEVIGSSKWTRFRNIDRSLFFKLNVSYSTSYHADRGDSAVVDFDNRYIADFGRIPTLYSYRGYDAVKLFVGAAVERRGGFVPEGILVPLQTPYGFVREPGGHNTNTQWVLVSYSDDYTISVR